MTYSPLRLFIGNGTFVIMKINAVVFDFAGISLSSIDKFPRSTIHIPKKDFLDFGEPLLFTNDSRSNEREVTARVLKENLMYADSFMFSILQSLLPKERTLRRIKALDAVAWLNANNPIGYNLSMGTPFYEYKLKRFLAFTAFGYMRSNMCLANLYQPYTIILWDSKPVCLAVYDVEGFMQFLMKHTVMKFIPKSISHGSSNVDVFELVLSFRLQLKELAVKPKAIS